MKKQLKTKRELFDYLMHGYAYELEDVSTKIGIQKRLEDNELEQELKMKTKEMINLEDLSVELKLGPSYNRAEIPWIQIHTLENKSGAKGRYVGISFSKDTNQISIWIGFGKTSKKKAEVLELTKQYKIRYSIIEASLQCGFEYNQNGYDAIIISKTIHINDFEEEEFEKDLQYITELYKAHEVRFENAIIKENISNQEQIVSNSKMTYKQLNEKMLTLIEQVGILAKEIKEFSKDDGNSIDK